MDRVLYQATDIESNIMKIIKEKYGARIYKDMSCYVLGAIMTFVKSYMIDNKSILVLGNKKDPDIVFYCIKHVNTFEDDNNIYYELNSSFNKETIKCLTNQSDIIKVSYMSDPEIISKFLYICNEYAHISMPTVFVDHMITTTIHELISWATVNKGVDIDLFGVFSIIYYNDIPVFNISPVIKTIPIKEGELS